MAGVKSASAKDGALKKRKRDNENDPSSKRARSTQKDKQSNGDSKSASVLQPDAQAVTEVSQFNNEEAGWRVSKPTGGRMLDIDPIISNDERLAVAGPDHGQLRHGKQS
jgi:NET1-associated nuclear protein 1 (U3 small nucleolar RNA-associated protein 17)